MSFLFNIPDSLKKTQNAAGNSDNPAPKRAFQRPATNYADLDDPNGGAAPPAPERRQRLNALQDRPKYSLRRAADGSIIPKPTMPPRTVGGQLRGAARPPPPSRGTLTRAGLIPAGARNQYSLRRTGAGKPAVPERHPSPAAFSGGSEEEGELGENEEEETGRGPSGSRAPREPIVKFAGLTRNSLFGGMAVEAGSTSGGEGRGLFAAGRTPSPQRLTRRREASPLNMPPPPLPTRAALAAPAAVGGTIAAAEGRGDRSSARTLTAHDLTGMRSVNDVAKQLRKLVGRSCPGDFDRYQLLDERDKLLCKLREIKPSFFSKSGSCRDMCPEKERYVRVVQMRIADYEKDMLEDMEPRRMVKEYSRSAADQEEPLEHEMRPAAVLEMTMEYLLTNIVDGTIESSPDSSKWYDFMWNRTRAIRKELTQQMILEESAVRLIECCTRMHMYAGFSLGRLRQEEFDPRMNEENLSKCLQSLRHLYEDLSKKEIFVESEAEFRAYDVMLHLTDSNILRQVLSYRRVVRESPAVRLALKLFSAIQSNNYTRFFRLVREQATYSQCCILFRYFGKMRLHAFNTMATAYHRGGTLPMDIVARVLAFESVEQAIDMAAQYGLSYTQERGETPALLPENKDFDPAAGELSVPAGWIEEKRQGAKLSEIFRGGASRLSVDAVTPVDSFDPSTATYSYDPVLQEYLARLGSAATDDPFASQNLVRVQQKRAEIVVERPVAAERTAAVAASSKPAFGGLTSFDKPSTGTAAAAGGASTAGGITFGKSTGSFGAGISGFGSGTSVAPSAPSFGGFGAKATVPGFSFAPGSTASSTTSSVEEKKPLISMKQEPETVTKFKPKPEISEARMEQTAEKLFTGVVEDVTKTVVRDAVTEERAAKKKEEEERRETERVRKEQQEREARLAAERAAAAAAAAKSAEKRRRSDQARVAACSEHLFKRALWPGLVREVIDTSTKEIAREAVREEEQRIADGIAVYKKRMHDLWLRQFTDQWKAYAKWRKEERQRVRQVLAAIVSRNPFEGIGAQSLKRRLSDRDADDWEAKRRRRPYGNIDPLTALAVIGFVERRQARIARSIVCHWREWAERRARRKLVNWWPLNRQSVVPRVRPPTPTDDQENYGSTSLPLQTGGGTGRMEKRQKSRRSIGIYPFLAADDSFLDGRATPFGGATPVREQREQRKPRVSGIFNSTAMPETTALSAIGFQTFVGRQERGSAASDADVEYAKALMDQTQWAVGDGARERRRRREERGEEGRREEWKSRPLIKAGETQPSWRGLFDVLDADPETRGRERASLRALETPAPLERTMMVGGGGQNQSKRPEWVPAPMPLHPWEREEKEEKERIVVRNAEIETQLAESKRLRDEAAADRARQDELLARLGY